MFFVRIDLPLKFHPAAIRASALSAEVASTQSEVAHATVSGRADRTVILSMNDPEA